MRKLFLLFCLFSLNFIQGCQTSERSDDLNKVQPENFNESKIQVRYLKKGQRVIPLLYSFGQIKHTNVKIPKLILSNHSETDIAIKKIWIDCYSDQKKLMSIFPQIKSLMNGNSAYKHMENIASDMSKINPNQSFIMNLSKTFVHSVNNNFLNSLTVNFQLDNGKVLDFIVPLEHYYCKGKYICPLKEQVSFIGNPGNCLYHRMQDSGEFAIDILLFQKIGDTFVAGTTINAEDSFILGKNVLAIGDGVVVEVGSQYKNEDNLSPNTKGFDQNTFQRISKKIGPRNTAWGNFVIIDHENGEFSFSCHLNEGSIKIKKGERVKKGDMIGQVGTTGQSPGPHLHFALIDGPDPYSANGLPIVFEDVPSDHMGMFNCKTNSIAVTDIINSAIRLPENFLELGRTVFNN